MADDQGWGDTGYNGDRNTKTPPGRAILADDPLSPGKQAEADTPFLVLVWFGNPHTPHEALPADKAPYATLSEKDQNYYGELTGIDRNVGKLRAALGELKVADNTLLWYCSDNGGAAGPKSTGNLRGSKGTLWEGGLRVPGLVEWPARIPKPFASDVPCSTLDIYPTVLAATGARADSQIEPLDGINLLPLFDRQMTERGKAIPFVARISQENSHAALLAWPYKLRRASALKSLAGDDYDPRAPGEPALPSGKKSFQGREAVAQNRIR